MESVRVKHFGLGVSEASGGSVFQETTHILEPGVLEASGGLDKTKNDPVIADISWIWKQGRPLIAEMYHDGLRRYTLVCAGVGIILSTILGLLIGIARLSTNYLISRLSNAYIELFRNIPILLQILFWYNIFLNALPHPKKSISFLDFIFINNRGFYLPNPVPQEGFLWVFITFIIAVASAIYLKRYLE